MANERLIKAWKAASQDLGIEIQSPFTLTLDDGIVVEADVLVRSFGSAQGTLVSLADIFMDRSDEIVQKGYGWSMLSRRYETYDREHFIDTLKDWGWSGPQEKCPLWISNTKLLDKKSEDKS